MSKLRTIWKNKYARVTLVLLALLVFISGGMMAIGGGSSDPNVALERPSFTMSFTLADGQAVTVGDVDVASQQTRRLDYTAPDRWVETVTASPDIVTSWGTFSDVGSYQRVDGNTYTSYDAVDGYLITETIESGRRIPGSYTAPMPLHGINDSDSPIQSYSRSATSARVCYNSSCTDNAQGILFTYSGIDYVYADDARGIPLKIGDSFQVTEVTVHSAHQAIP
jgi:hypothetical protein